MASRQPRQPDFDVKVSKEYKAADGSIKRRWFTVGAAWNDDYGGATFELYMFPGARFKFESRKSATNAQDNAAAASTANAQLIGPPEGF